MARPAQEPKRKTFTLPTDGALLELDLALGGVGYDPLTGCLSYGRVLEAVGSEIQRSRRRGTRLSCCSLGLEAFEMVNGAEGPEVGGRVLAAGGEAIRAGVRAYDSVARFDGDEFLIVLPETDVRVAARVARRLQLAVGAAVAQATDRNIEALIGIAVWSEGESATDLIEAAEHALRGAKRVARIRALRG